MTVATDEVETSAQVSQSPVEISTEWMNAVSGPDG